MNRLNQNRWIIWIILFGIGAALVIGLLLNSTLSPVYQQAEADALLMNAEAIQLQRQSDIAYQNALNELDVEAEKAAAPFAQFGRNLLRVAPGIAAVVLLPGLALALVIAAIAGGLWMLKRSTAIYPNEAGQMPILSFRGPGYQMVLDMNRSTSAAVQTRIPSVFDLAFYFINRVRGKDAELPQPSWEYLDDKLPEMLKVEGGRNAMRQGMAAALTRPGANGTLSQKSNAKGTTANQVLELAGNDRMYQMPEQVGTLPSAHIRALLEDKTGEEEVEVEVEVNTVEGEFIQ